MLNCGGMAVKSISCIRLLVKGCIILYITLRLLRHPSTLHVLPQCPLAPPCWVGEAMTLLKPAIVLSLARRIATSRRIATRGWPHRLGMPHLLERERTSRTASLRRELG